MMFSCIPLLSALALLFISTGLAYAIPNDQFGAASDLGSATSVSASLDTRLATRQVGEPSHDNNTSTGTTWWRWTAPANGQWTITHDESISGSYDLAVYTGANLEDLVLVGEEGGDPLVVNVIEGVSYSCAFAREGISKLDFEFHPHPANDAFENAADLGSASNVSVKGTTIAGTREDLEPLHGGDSSQGPSSWWEWEAPADGILSLDLTGSENSGWIVAVYTGETLDALTEISVRSSNTSLQSLTSFRVSEGERLLLAAARSTSDLGDDLCLNLQFDNVVNNDLRADAADLGNTAPIRFQGSTVGATDDDGGSDRTIWWKWSPPSKGIVTLQVDESESSWPGRLAAFRELPDLSLESITSSWNDTISFPVSPGAPYYFEALNRSSEGRAMTIDLSFTPTPANDDFANGAPLAMGETQFDTTASTIEENEPGFSIDQSLWWTWTPSEDGAVTLEMDYIAFLTLEVFVGSDLNSLSSVTSNSGTFATYVGETYHIRLSSFITTPESGAFHSTFQPFDTGHDNFADAHDLGAGWSANGAASLEGTTTEPNEPNISSGTNQSTWWKWTAPADAVFVLDHDTFPNSGWLRVYNGTQLTNLVAAPIVNGAYQATTGQVFYFSYKNSISGDTNVQFSLTAFPTPPLNDHFANATDLGAVNEWNEELSFHQTTREANEPQHLGETWLQTRWWTWTPSTTQNVAITFDAPSSQQIAVYTGNALTSLVPVASNDSSTAQVQFQALAGESYSIALVTQYQQTANWSLQSWSPPAGDSFATAIDLNSAPLSSLLGDLEPATASPDDPAPTSSNYDRSIWFRWIAPSDGRLNILYPSFYGGEVRLFEGSSLPGLIELDDDPHFVTAGQEYHFLVQGSAEPFNKGLEFFPSPANDQFVNAINWGSQTSTSETLDIRAATLEPGEPEVIDPASTSPGSVWWHWTAPFDGALTIRTTYDAFQGNALALFEGTNLNTLVEIDRITTTGSVLTFQTTVTSGTSYSIMAGAADTRDDAPWSIELDIIPTPANNLWTTAFDLGNGSPAFGTGTNVDATPGEFEEIDSYGATVWWKWTAPANGSAIAIAEIEDETERIFIYRESGGVLTPVLKSRFDGGSGSWGETWAANSGESYYIAVTGYYPDDAGHIDLSLYLIDGPANDNFADRLLLPADPGEVLGTSTGALLEADEPTHSSSTGTSSAWWSWTAPTTGTYRLVLQSDFTTTLALYTGSNLPSLAPVAASNSGELLWVANAGSTYQIAVADHDGDQGDFSFVLEPLAAISNDAFVDFLELGNAYPVQFSGYNPGASAEPNEPNHAGQPASQSLWYRWTAPDNELISINDRASIPTLDIAIYTGTDLNNLTPIASGRGNASFASSAGQTYIIAVDNLIGETGLFDIELNRIELSHDAFANAIVLTGGLTEVDGNITFATSELGERSPAYQTLWWEWTATNSDSLYLYLSGPATRAGSIFYIRPGDSRTLGNLRTLQSTFTDNVAFRPDSGNTYFFRLGTTTPNQIGQVNLSFSGPGSEPPAPADDLTTGPPNDDFANRILLDSTLPAHGAVDMVNATNEVGEPISFLYRGAWWSWIAPETGTYRIERDPFNYSPIVDVYTGNQVDSLTTLLSTRTSGLFEAQAGVEYQISLQSPVYDIQSSLDRGDRMAGFTLTRGPDPTSNDLFANRIDLGMLVGSSVPGNNIGASAEPEEPDHAGEPASRSVWWSWTAPETRSYSINAYGYSLRVGLYTGEDLSSLVPIASGNEPLIFDAIADTTYQIALDRDGIADFSLGLYESDPLPPPAANDSYANADVLTGGFQTVSSNAAGSTLEPGEPLHGSDELQDASLWWTWTAPADGATTVTSSTYSRVSVYVGNNFQSLTPFVSNTYKTTFHAVAGTTYSIVVSDPSNDLFDLTIDQTTPAPANDQLDQAILLSGTTTQVAGTTIGATTELGEPRHVDNTSTPFHTVWYKWTCPESDLYSLVQTDNSAARLAIYTGTDFPSLTPLTYGEDEATFFATAGVEYLIAVAYLFSPADFTLDLEKIGYAVNDQFSDRISLGITTGVSVQGTTTHSTREPDEPFHNNDSSPGGTVWWSWIAPTTGKAVLISDHSLILAAYTGTDVNQLQLVEEVTTDRMEFPVTAGTQYQLAIGDSSATYPVGDFEFTIWIDPPVNDNFMNRIILPSALPAEVTAMNFRASAELGEPQHRGNTPIRSLWWEWTPDTTIQVDFKWPSRGGVYTGQTLPFLTPVEGTLVASNTLRFTAHAGTPYLFALDDSTSRDFNFSLTPSRALPPNDFFADAIVLSGENTSSASHSIGATTEPDEPLNATRSLWWSWTAPRSGFVKITSNGGVAYLFSPSQTLTDLEVISPERESYFKVVGGTTYHLMVDSSSGRDLTLSLEMTPPGDFFEDPITVENLDSIQLDLQLGGATWEPLEPMHNGAPAEQSIWIRWTAPYSGPVRLKAGYSWEDVRLAVYTGQAITTLSPLAAGETEISFNAVAGQTYRLALDTPFGSIGVSPLSFQLTADPIGYTVWRDSFFSDPHDPDGSPFSNPDGDLLSNIFELAFGKNPRVNDSADIPVTIGNHNDHILLSVRRPVGIEGIRYSFEVSDDLQAQWNWTDSLNRNQWQEDHGDGTETFHILLLDYLYSDHPKFFARLRVELGNDAIE